MCNAFTSILMKDGRVLWEPAEDSHSALMNVKSVRDGVNESFRGRNFLKMESLPPYWQGRTPGERPSLTARDALAQYFGDEFKVIVDDESVHWYSPRHEESVRAATMQWRDKVVVDRIDKKILDESYEPPFMLEDTDVDRGALELAAKEFYYHYRMYGFEVGSSERVQMVQDNDYGIQRAMAEYLGDTLSRLMMSVVSPYDSTLENSYGSFSASGVNPFNVVVPSNFRSSGRNQYMAQGRKVSGNSWWSTPANYSFGADMAVDDVDSIETTVTPRVRMGHAMATLWLATFLKPIEMSKPRGSGSKQISFAADRGGDLAYAARAVRTIGEQGFIVEGMSLGGEVYLTNGKDTRVYSCRELEENVRADMRIRERSSGYSEYDLKVDELKWS